MRYKSRSAGKAALYCISGKEHGKVSYHKRPIKIRLDQRPALMRYKQMVTEEGTGAKSEKVAYFRRTGVDEYTQLTSEQEQQVLSYLAMGDYPINKLTTVQLEEILAKPRLHAPDTNLVQAQPPNDQRTPGGIIIPR